MIFLVTLAIFAGSTDRATGAGLAGSEWRPIAIGPSAPGADTTIFVQFKADGKLAGNGGCNRFFGSYRISGGKISFGPIGATRMACPAPAMELETALFIAFEAAKSFRKRGAELVLFDVRGGTILRMVQTDRD